MFTVYVQCVKEKGEYVIFKKTPRKLRAKKQVQVTGYS